ncbi:hypothetical protein [Candidatus Pelagibacter sp.]|mgnify:FL=1|uniref:hypothetical protein n=1 Tax=Candidatus Pelagibacter sp. TaxID=2024849 RepID=UPI003F852286
MKKLTPNNNIFDCPVCDGTKKTKIIKNIAQIGKFYIGKEVIEDCKFCSEKKIKQVYELDGDTLH